MKNLKRVGFSLILVAVLFTVVFAGETPSPPCAPGETSSPPCTSAPMTSDEATPGQTDTPPSSAVDVNTIVEAVELALSLV